MLECKSHTGHYDDLDNPLTDDGQLFMPGKRSCGHSDCVQPAHIEGYEHQWIPNSRSAFQRELAKKIYAQVAAIGANGYAPVGSPCLMNECFYPVKARGLCMNHWTMFSRAKPDLVKRIRRFKADDFAHIPDPVFARKEVDWPTVCIIDNCSKKVRSRSLCDNHYHTYLRLVKAKKIQNRRPIYSLADFSHVPTDKARGASPIGNCSMPDCNDGQSVKTLCENHYRTYLKLTRKKDLA